MTTQIWSIWNYLYAIMSHVNRTTIAFDTQFYPYVWKKSLIFLWFIKCKRKNHLLATFLRYADVCILPNCHTYYLWLHSEIAEFKWKVLFGNIGIWIYIIVWSSAQQLELHATIAMWFCWIFGLFHTFLSISLE